jgi:hypothetical protein
MLISNQKLKSIVLIFKNKLVFYGMNIKKVNFKILVKIES